MTDDPGAPVGFDPGAPGSAEAAAAANFGAEAAMAEGDAPAHPPGAPAVLRIDPNAAHAFLGDCLASDPPVRYGLGAKVPFHGAVPGRDFTEVDCSGFVRELVFRATNPPFNFPDGSVVQREWVERQGFARGSVADAKAQDGAVRIAFLTPQASPSHIGHVVMVHDGVTLESHGRPDPGPDSLPWTGQGWQASAQVFVLTPP